jgi:DNA-binding HxlR family transcriptional regulator
MLFGDTFFRCNCPVTSALDIVGDKWTLVVIKLMLIEHKKTFKEFSESTESILFKDAAIIQLLSISLSVN